MSVPPSGERRRILGAANGLAALEGAHRKRDGTDVGPEECCKFDCDSLIGTRVQLGTAGKRQSWCSSASVYTTP